MAIKRHALAVTGRRTLTMLLLIIALAAPGGVANAQHSGATDWIFNWEFQGAQLISSFGEVTSNPSEAYRVDSFLQKKQLVIWDYTGAWYRVTSGGQITSWDYDSWADDGDAHFFPDGNARYRVIDELDILYHGVWQFLDDVVSPEIVCDSTPTCEWD